MSEGPAFNNPEKLIEKSSQQEILREKIDALLEDYFLLISKRGLDGVDQNRLNKDIDEKRQELVNATQELNGQIESDEAFAKQVEEQLELADKRIELGHEELAAREDGKDNITALVADMKEYSEQLKKFDSILDTIKGSIEKKDEDAEELEKLVFELKTMINSFIKVGEETQRLITSLKIDNKKELVQKHVAIMNNAFRYIAGIQDIDKTIGNKDRLNKLKTNFYRHFDEVLHFYEELRGLSKDNKQE